MTLFAAFVLASALGTRCDLEDQGWCDFNDEKCVFSDVYRLPTDKSSPLEVLLDKNIRSKNTNNGCPLPQPSNETNPKPFVIEIEPCFSNGTATPANLQACPDIPDEYYTTLGKPVLSDTGNLNKASGAIMGIPIEYNVISLGKNLVMGNVQNTKSKRAETSVQGTLLSKFRWRTLPLTAAAYAKSMQETATTFKDISKQYIAQIALPTIKYSMYALMDQQQPKFKTTEGTNTGDCSVAPFVYSNKPAVVDFCYTLCGDNLMANLVGGIEKTAAQIAQSPPSSCHFPLLCPKNDYCFKKNTKLTYYAATKTWACPANSATCTNPDASTSPIYWAETWPLASFNKNYTLFSQLNPDSYYVSSTPSNKSRTGQDRYNPLPGCQWTSQVTDAKQPKYLNAYEKPSALLDTLRMIKIPQNTVIKGILPPQGSGALKDYRNTAGKPITMLELILSLSSIEEKDLEKYATNNLNFRKYVNQAGFIANLPIYGNEVTGERNAYVNIKSKCNGVSSDTANRVQGPAAAFLYLLGHVMTQTAESFVQSRDNKDNFFDFTTENADYMNATYGGFDLNDTNSYFFVGGKLNPDLQALNNLFQNYAVMTTSSLNRNGVFEIPNPSGVYAAPTSQNYFWANFGNCMNKKSGNLWTPFECGCFPVVIDATQCIKGIPPPEPLSIVVGDPPTIDYSSGTLPIPPVSLVPYQELTCPLEVQFADDRTPDMSPKEQRDSVYVASSTLIADIPEAFESVGRGCYMCFANRFNNLTKTLETPGLAWLDHYHPNRCLGARALPIVKSIDSGLYDDSGAGNPPQSGAQTDAFSLYGPGRDFSYTVNQPLGVYTLYPYFELEPIPYQFARNVNDDPGKCTPAGKCGPDSINFQQWEDNLARQIGYYQDPHWWVTVEVVGVEKAKGGQVLRNFHGRMIEEGLVDFIAEKFTYNIPEPFGVTRNDLGESIDWDNYLTERNFFYPNNCYFNTIDMTKVSAETPCAGNNGPEARAAGGFCEELACKTDVPGDTVYNILKGNLTINFNIDIGDSYNGFNEILTGLFEPAPKNVYFTNENCDGSPAGKQCNPYQFLIASTETAGGFILPTAYDGITNPTVEAAIEWVTTLPLVRRKDGVCIDRPGEVKIEMPFAAQCLFGAITEKTTRSLTVSACQPDKLIAWYERGGLSIPTVGTPPQDVITADMSNWLQDLFLEVHPTGVAKEIFDVFDSVEFKLALALLALEDPAFADLNLADIIWCLSPLGPTSPLQIIEFLLLYCQACTPSSDSGEVQSGSPGECFTIEGGAPCLGYVGPPSADSSERNSPGWASMSVVSYPVPCMFEQVATVIRPTKGDDGFDGQFYDMCDAPFLKRMFETPFTLFDAGPESIGPGPTQINDYTLGGIAVRDWVKLESVEDIIDEINIMGVTVSSSLFSRTDPTMFPNGLFVTSTHPLIHTKISRDLGSGSVIDRGCNVALIGIPNITFYNVEFDNSDCQEQGLNQLTYETANDFRGIENSQPTFQRAFMDLKAWNMAPVHVTNMLPDTSPTNLNFTSVKLTASISFRRMFPGRPLMSIDNDGAAGGAFVNVDRMFLSEINDTHKYRDTRDTTTGPRDPLPLMPIHIIFWHVAGNCTLGSFPDELDIVTFSERDAFSLEYDMVSTSSYNDPCKGVPSPASKAQPGQFDTYLQYQAECLENNCTIQFAGKKEADWETQKARTFCRKERRFPIVNNLVVLDGADFFDIAYDRYRCFDRPKINCAAEPVMPFVYVIFSFVMVYIIFFTFIRSTGLLQPDECLEILQSIDDALAEATEPDYDPLGKDAARSEDLEASKKLGGPQVTRRRITSAYS